MTHNTILAQHLQSTSTKRATPPAAPEDPTMSDADTPIYARSDTMLGVCHGLGEEIGIHANWLRAALGLGLFWNPWAMVAAYVTLGALLALLRWAFPFHRRVAPSATTPAVPHSDNDDGALQLSEAA
jgi:phage shock protein PspC (stress-responsive transcriptional regulator)